MGSTYRVTEIVGTSTQSCDDAIRNAVARADQTLRNLDWFEVTETRGHIEDGQIGHFQVTVKVGFRLEDELGDRGGEPPRSSATPTVQFRQPFGERRLQLIDPLRRQSGQ